MGSRAAWSEASWGGIGGTGAIPFGAGMTRPTLVSKGDPQYTREALTARVQGLILVKCIITVEGTLRSCRVVKGLPFMDKAVLESLAQWKFTPVTFQGRPVNVEYVIPVRRRMADVLSKGGVEAAAATQFGPNAGYLGRVLDAGLGAYRIADKTDPELAFESVARALERHAQREVQSMRRGQEALGTISSTAPFIGLVGTVMGIVTSFQLMAASGSGGLATVSVGIAEALVTTVFGLLVAASHWPSKPRSTDL